MNSKKISDVEAFKKESDKARNIPLSKEDIVHVNEICQEAEIEEFGSIVNKLSLTRKKFADSNSANV